MNSGCPFCSIDTARIWFQTPQAVVVWDAYPISQGHSLVIPRQHVASMFDLSEAEQRALWQVAVEVRKRLVDKFHPDGFNIGVNDGPAAGQTVMHLHIHVIPRFKDDVPDPRGGIRWVIPDKAPYWS